LISIHFAKFESPVFPPGGGNRQNDVDENQNAVECSDQKTHFQNGRSLGASTDGGHEGKEKLKRNVEKELLDPQDVDAIYCSRKEAILTLQHHVNEHPCEECPHHPLERSRLRRIRA
jgi:hypothetical protein